MSDSLIISHNLEKLTGTIQEKPFVQMSSIAVFMKTYGKMNLWLLFKYTKQLHSSYKHNYQVKFPFWWKRMKKWIYNVQIIDCIQYVCIKSTFSRYFDLSEILILASSTNRCPANSCFCREHSFDILERTNLLNLQQENAIEIMPIIFPCLLIIKYITSFFYPKHSGILSQLQKQLRFSILSHSSTRKWNF